MKNRLLFVVTEDRYFVSHRLHLAKHAISLGYEVGFLGNIVNHRDILERAGIAVYDWNIDRGAKGVISQARSFFTLFKQVKCFKPDIVHAVSAKPILYSALACALLRVKSRVHALAGLGYMQSSSTFGALLIKRVVFALLRMSLCGEKTVLILQNDDDASLLIANKVVAREKIRIIRGAGVNTDKFNKAVEPNDETLVVLPARMLWDKGVGEFVACAQIIGESKISARFVLVGDPDPQNPESIPSETIESWVKAGLVDWWGYRDDMTEVFARASIVCLPSYREGLPKSLLEAASSCLPIVSFDVPGCREIVVDGHNGFLLEFGDISGLAKSLEILLKDECLREKMGQRGRELVELHFSQEKIAAETAVAWDEVR